jgi:hypothetical protein
MAQSKPHFYLHFIMQFPGFNVVLTAVSFRDNANTKQLQTILHCAVTTALYEHSRM